MKVSCVNDETQLVQPRQHFTYSCNMEKKEDNDAVLMQCKIFTMCDYTDLFMKIYSLNLVVCIKALQSLWDPQTDRLNKI